MHLQPALHLMMSALLDLFSILNVMPPAADVVLGDRDFRGCEQGNLSQDTHECCYNNT